MKFLEPNATYCHTLKELRRKRPKMKDTYVCLLHDNDHTHTAFMVAQLIPQDFHWTVMTNPPRPGVARLYMQPPAVQVWRMVKCWSEFESATKFLLLILLNIPSQVIIIKLSDHYYIIKFCMHSYQNE